MGTYNEVQGDLLELFNEGDVDFIAHGCNCFHTMGSGIARQIREDCPQAFKTDKKTPYGSFAKLGNFSRYDKILNCYIQYNYGTKKCHLDYEALTICLRKINHEFTGYRIGLPQIGCGLAGGDWKIVKEIIQNELKDMDVTVVIYNKENK